MYPQPELNQLAAHKVALRLVIAVRRTQCTEAAAQVARPFDRLDRMLAFWRRLSPFVQFAAVPLGFFVARAIIPRRKMLGSLARWGPVVFGAARGIGSAVKTRFESSRA